MESAHVSPDVEVGQIKAQGGQITSLRLLPITMGSVYPAKHLANAKAQRKRTGARNTLRVVLRQGSCYIGVRKPVPENHRESIERWLNSNPDRGSAYKQP